MPLANATPYAAVDVPMLDPHGREVVVLILKATFDVKGPDKIVPAAEPSPVRLKDVLRDPDAPERSSVLFPTDVCVEKRGTDVVVVGNAVSKRKVMCLDVGVQVKSKTLSLRVHGPREYFRGIMEVAISAAVPFEEMPMAWERAYGGMSEDCTLIEHRNPSGVGVAKSDRSLIGKLAPQIEHPSLPHKTAKDRHAPMGVGAILPHWSPRRDFAGTFDEQWKKTRMPLMPLDYDMRYANFAAPPLQMDQALVPGDAISIMGMSRELFAFSLPRLPIRLIGRYDDKRDEARPKIDTLLLQPDKGRIEMVVRKAFPIGRGRSKLRELVADVDA